MKRPMLVYYDVLDFQPTTLDYLRTRFDVITSSDPDMDGERAYEEAEAVFAPMGYRFSDEKIAAFKKLAVIGSPTTGIPHIDEASARERKIDICSLRDQQAFLSSITPTAELAWGLILAVTRHIPWAAQDALKSQWGGRSWGARTPRMLSRMKLGVLGLGRLGSWMAKYATAFGMSVFYYDPLKDEPAYNRCSSLKDLARASDIVTLHVHATPETDKIIGRDFIQAMPRGSFLINTARGSILDEGALLDALKSGHLAGAGLDTLDGEHLPGFKEGLSEHPLIRYAKTHDNLVLTPHCGGATRDAWEKTEKHIADMMIHSLEQQGKM